MPNKDNDNKVNLFDIVPVAESFVTWNEKDDALMELIVPRFKTKWMYRMLERIGRDPNIHITLEEHGSAVWKLIDGKRDVRSIIELMGEHFNHEKDYEYRICKYMEMLHQQRMIKYIIPKQK